MTINSIGGGMEQMLASLRATSAATQLAPTPPAEKSGATDQVEFSQLLSGVISHVNQSQQGATTLQSAFEKGDPGVSLAEVMIASQKANLSFEALNQVRNKMISAYQEIMRMPI